VQIIEKKIEDVKNFVMKELGINLDHDIELAKEIA
jgi:hypothetical protein